MVQDTPTAAAREAVSAAHEDLERLRARQRALPEQHAAAVKDGNFEQARALKSEQADIEDRVSFGGEQLRIAEGALLRSELFDAEHDVREAVPVLEQAFRNQTRAQIALDDANAAVRSAQARLAAAQSRVQSLQQRQSNLERTGKGE